LVPCRRRPAFASQSRDFCCSTTVHRSQQAWCAALDLLSTTSMLTKHSQYLLVASSYWLNFEELWSTWPSRQISGGLKWYYLVQLSFWLQQILAINMEKRRKDYAQMSTHHVVTSILMYIAYTYRWTKVGHVVLIIMDVVDFLLPVSKQNLHLKLRRLLLSFSLVILTSNSLRKCSNTSTTKTPAT